MEVFNGLAELVEAAGEELGTSDWREADRQRISMVAGTTGDHQWRHVDPEEAAQGPVGGRLRTGS